MLPFAGGLVYLLVGERRIGRRRTLGIDALRLDFRKIAAAAVPAGLLHTKSISVDGTMAMFGTVNLDMRSLWLNYEVALFIYEPDFAKALRALQQTYLEQSTRLDPAVWNQRAFTERFLESALRLVSPLL